MRSLFLGALLVVALCLSAKAEHVVMATVMTEDSGPRLATGEINRAAHERFIALPSRVALGRWVRVKALDTGRVVIAKVRDVGPWSTNDVYWTRRRQPLAEKMLSDFHPEGTRNLAGIDLSLCLARDLGWGRNSSGLVAWTFVKENSR